MRSRFLTCCIIALVSLLTILDTALAHRMDLFVYVDGAVLHGEAAYAPSGAPDAGQVRIFTPDGATLAELALEPDGTFRYQTPVRAELRIEVDTPDAHRATYTLSEDELPAGLTAWDAEGMPETDAVAIAESEATTAPSTSDAGSSLYQYSIAAAVDQAVSRQTSVLRNEIARIEQRLRIRDILGGFGYIAGVVGLLAYLKFKPSRPER